MIVTDMRFDCRRCARIVGEPKPRIPEFDVECSPEPELVRSFSVSDASIQGLEVPAVSYLVPNMQVWRAECHLLGAIQHGQTQEEAEEKLAKKLKSLPKESLKMFSSKGFRIFGVQV